MSSALLLPVVLLCAFVFTILKVMAPVWILILYMLHSSCSCLISLFKLNAHTQCRDNSILNFTLS